MTVTKAKAKAKPKAAAKEKKAPVVKDTVNGVTRPKAGTATGRVWEIADALSKKTKKPIERKAVLEATAGEGINPATAATQYGRWRKYNGLEKEVRQAA